MKPFDSCDVFPSLSVTGGVVHFMLFGVFLLHFLQKIIF